MNIRTFDLNNDELSYEFEYNVNETKSLKEIMSNKENITIDNLRRIALWKLDRVLDVNDNILEDLQKIAIENAITIHSELVKNTIKELIKSNGIGFPMASSILKFIRPDIFPIIDVRAYRALYGKKITYNQYTIDIYTNYTLEIYKISKKKNIPLHTVDEQLYKFDKEHNGKIN